MKSNIGKIEANLWRCFHESGILHRLKIDRMNKERIAIIDCGTNTFHLLIADISGDKVEFILRERKSVRIGKGGISHGMITTDAADRAVRALREFSETIRTNGVVDTFAFATSAFRSASNGQEVAARIAGETGINIDIIDGEMEAALIYSGVRYALGDLEETALVIDIGGGSVEFIIGKADEVLWKRSYEIGAQRLIDLFYNEDPIPADAIDAMNRFLAQHLEGLKEALESYRPEVFVGSSGSFETLSEMYMLSEGLEPVSESELYLTFAAFDELLDKLIRLPRAERRKIPGMIKMRIDMIVVASILIDYIIRLMSPRKIRISTYALKEGVLRRITEGKKVI